MRWQTLPASLALVIAIVSAGASSYAHSAGQPGPDCVGCHAQGSHDIEVSTDPAVISPGSQVDVTVTITASAGKNAGIFVAANEGAFSLFQGEGLGAVPAGLTHTSPKALSSGRVSFRFAWTAPSAKGAVRFDVSTLVGNGNSNSGGDQASGGDFDFVYGCEPKTYFRDFDGDGFGANAFPLVHCEGSVPSGYALDGGDCNESKETAHPGAVEFCNQQDDDCDGEIDDDAIPVTLYPDADLDGYYGTDESISGEAIMGCVPTPGYAAEPGDCKPNDPAVNPGAIEICNLLDDNCDNRDDEYVRPRCGEGWCEREASDCNPATCYPGEPIEETCNLLDDNCDGLVDEGSICPTGQSCVAAQCIEVAAPALPPPAAEDPSGCAFSGNRTFPKVGWLLAIAALHRRRSAKRLSAGSRTATR